jgi:selenocysteine lyase/cysteine desulfurase
MQLQHQALAFFDFAGSGAYVSIDVDGDGREESMDAIFMSPHKFIGGPGCAGVLVAKRKLFDGVYGVETKTPTFPGEGTVSFVGPYGQDYEETVEAREDAGTPGIVQAIRTGLAFQVKGMVGAERIEAIERHHCEEVKFLGRDVNISLTGCNRSAYFDSNRRVPIFSFNIVSLLNQSSMI